MGKYFLDIQYICREKYIKNTFRTCAKPKVANTYYAYFIEICMPFITYGNEKIRTDNRFVNLAPLTISASELLDKITDRMHPQIKKPIIDE